MMTRSELMLVLLAQQGDRDALNSLLAHIQPRLFRYIMGIVGGDDAAEDVKQEALLRIARKIGWVTVPHAFDAWSYHIASNEACRFLERRAAPQRCPGGVPPSARLPPANEARSLRHT